MSLQRLAIILALLAVCGGVALFLVKGVYKVPEMEFGKEVAKSLLQLVFVSVLGTLVSLLVNEYNRQRRRVENLEEFRKNLLSKLHRSYADAKRTRRLLRAGAFIPSYYGTLNEEAQVNVEFYDAQARVLNDVQLDLEIIAKDAETNPYAFSEPKAVQQPIRTMEERLKLVIKEWQKVRGNFVPEEEIRIKSLPVLMDFVAPSDKSQFALCFIGNYVEAVKSLRRDILFPPPTESLKALGVTPPSGVAGAAPPVSP
jgi:hypothetical protein